jgi:hypothetical protein
MLLLARLRNGNDAILRGGTDSVHSAGAIHAAMTDGLKTAGLPEAALQYVRNTDRAAVGLMLEGLNGTIDLIIPRGGKGLTGRVMREARVPVLAHLEGICHVYVHDKAELGMARAIVLNHHTRRTSECSAAEKPHSAFLPGEIGSRFAGKKIATATATTAPSAERNHTMWCQDIKPSKRDAPLGIAALPTSPAKL